MTSSAKGTPLKCLIIDDDLDDQEIFALAVEQLDDTIQCSFANDCAAAIGQLTANDQNVPDWIFIDVNMPRMNGIECLDRIRTIDHVKHVTVCMISTSADPSLIAEAKSLGAADFLVKPADLTVLSEMLGQFMNINVRSDER